ncbi:AAA family ATPase [Clostridium tyrobutyricum]|uniref:AAA family ATPase n=1 Tax=Clostridium tyrobutyricum TaxID=1519 RepID=UPI0020112A29|nr:AAA family ATPase [Clostridium tyrobutyricum]MBR9648471.1 AAA family ATPase [Clostridium tyrobutyricum]
MELVYIWIDKYRTFKNTGINLSNNKFIVKYNLENNSIQIQKNKDYVQLYPDNILNINLFLGKNSSGKSNLLDLIGMRIEDRNNHNYEIETVYKNPHKTVHNLNDIKEIRKKYKYFYLYYLYEDSDGNSRFCIEGNDIDSYIDLFANKEKIDTKKSNSQINYWREKYWFSFVCTYDNQKLTYICDVTDDLKDRGISTKDIGTFILFREQYDDYYYSYSSLKNKDEYKIAIPRRVAKFNTKCLYKKISFLIKQVKSKNKLMYLDSKYTLSIIYDSVSTKEDTNIYNFTDIKHKLTGVEKNICKILMDICTFHMLKNEPDIYSGQEYKQFYKILKNNIAKIKLEKENYEHIKQYYKKVIESIAKSCFTRYAGSYVEKEIDNFLKKYQKFQDTLERIFIKEKYGLIEILDNSIKVHINKDCNEELISELIKSTIDEKIYSNINQYSSIFDGFFEYNINFLSDGELAYLGIMSSLDEQISILTSSESNLEKKKYILLFDEPESRMHPELARQFINSLVDFLSQYTDKTFQIILASHSPFLVSDIPNTNIFSMIKEDSRSCLNLVTINTFGQNIHRLLQKTFFMNYTIGEYSRKIIEKSNDYLNKKLDSKIESYKYDFNKIEKVEKIVDLIGEDLIKTNLRNKIEIVKDKSYTHKLGEVIHLYDNLSSKEKYELINHIINSQRNGTQDD